MAKDKKWVDCPVCGSAGSMVLETNKTFESNIKDLGKIKVTGLTGYFCKVCKDGFFNRTSANKIEEAHMRLKAEIESSKVHVSEVVHVREVTKILHNSRQDAYRLMKTGKLPYVLVAGEIHPYRRTIEEAKKKLIVGKSQKRKLQYK
ncbi:YgiT-type zinc finger protein [Leptospira bandrabouensis]|uniref:YgiT-type zinc finger protein n=1 Tax=Leptospira bandrabouensis TaxID=2484903 RepID=UPI0010910D46|nr:YgiT-type zinc finger protein [Leptospira bandrabouensis]TGN08605.1 YgiT-type zinc finger protein [Leptospira bandrabouensis]